MNAILIGFEDNMEHQDYVCSERRRGQRLVTKANLIVMDQGRERYGSTYRHGYPADASLLIASLQLARRQARYILCRRSADTR